MGFYNRTVVVDPISRLFNFRQGNDWQAGPVTGFFNGLHRESNFLAAADQPTSTMSEKFKFGLGVSPDWGIAKRQIGVESHHVLQSLHTSDSRIEVDHRNPIIFSVQLIHSLFRRMTAFTFAVTMLSASAQEIPRPAFPAGIRLPAAARGEAAINALGKKLPEIAAHYRKTPEQLRAMLRSDKCLHASTEGRLFYACELHKHAEAPVAAEGPSAIIGPTDPAPVVNAWFGSLLGRRLA